MNAITEITLSADARSKLVKAVGKHPLWADVRARRGINAADLNSSKALLLDVCAELNINVIETLTATTEQAEVTTEARAEAVTTAAAVSFVSTPKVDDAAAQLAKLLATLAGNSLDRGAVERIIDERLTEALKDAVPTVRIEVTRNNVVTATTEGHVHAKFRVLLAAATARAVNGYVPAIWITGPAGSGKTYAVQRVAEMLNLSFHFNGAISMEHHLLGFVDAAGKYHTTPFREAYEKGGVYLFDEVDGSDNAALLALNAALANGRATFPDGAQVERHKDCVIVATANTWGLGATSDYVGRAKLDAAFVDRFGTRIDWQYDVALEVAISGNEGWARRVIAARERAKQAGLKVVISPRASIAGAALIAAGISEDEVAEMTYLANLTRDQIKVVEGR